MSVGRGRAEEAEVAGRQELAAAQVRTGTGNRKVHRDVWRKRVQIIKVVMCNSKW